MSLFFFTLASINKEVEAANDVSNADLDRTSLRRFLDGEESGFLELYDKYKRPLFNLMYSYVHSQERAEDLVQEVFLAFHVFAPSFDFKYAPAGVLFRIARNKAMNMKLSAAYKRNTAFDKEYMESIHDGRYSQEHIVLIKEFRSQMEVTCSKLKKDVREVFFLRLDNNMSYKDIQETLGISNRTAKRHFRKALDALYIELKKNGFTVEGLI